ncbi:tetratricopeptide repeat protein [Psychroserpens sp. SPM9]|uniref:tetratricopeptide repeat protein n=1 Tax=Psychroserpens sp. SPM9 TaxID=2975598 RepID=UPI0021A78E34|nr:tetratricopeptide repeat protein [Psychroserpens sp. SPM9]MDG5490529.1 tetratricopeptide repeat protein [Psychroserpens sp. SPM9]
MLRLRGTPFTVLLSFYSLFITAQETPEYYVHIIETTTEAQEKFNALDSLLFNFNWRDDIVKLANFTETYVDLAIKKKKYESAIEATLRASNAINTHLGQRERALKLLNKVEGLKDKTDDTYLLGGIYLKKGGAYFNGKNYDEAIKNYSKAIDNYSDKDSIYIADAIFFRGQVYFSKGNLATSINDYNLAAQYYENLGDQEYVYYIKSSIANIYTSLGFYDKAIQENKALIEKRKKANQKSGLFIDYFNQGLIYGKLKDDQSKEASLLKSLEYYDDYNEKSNLDLILLHSELTKLYLKANRNTEANLHYKKASNLIEGIDKNTIAGLAFNVSKINVLSAEKKYSQAKFLAEQTLESAKKWGEVSLILELYEVLQNIHLIQNNKAKALDYFRAYSQLNDSINSVTKTNAFSYYQTLYETKEQEQEIIKQNAKIELLQKDKTIQESKKKLWVFVLSVIILIALAIIYFIKQRAERLKLNIANHKKELEIFTSELLHKSREYELLSSELKVLKADQKSENKLDKLQDLTTSKILTAEDWETFKSKFENVYPKFFVKVRMTHSDITNAEERLLALEKLNLKTPEIANILGVSTDSVVKNRYRLRKKLGISRATSITDFVEA